MLLFHMLSWLKISLKKECFKKTYYYWFGSKMYPTSQSTRLEDLVPSSGVLRGGVFGR